MNNYFTRYDWQTILNENPPRIWNLSSYYKILSPEFPDFLNKYLELPILQRLKGIGLLCGTDWTNLYKNRFYYSRYDHSVGVALIVWNFTHDKAQTIAGLLHDVSTPVFSHVSDFRKGDALTQTATEETNSSIIQKEKQLMKLLAEDGLTVDQVEDYHKYPIADNEIPQLSADRLEYMFPSGAALEGSWSLEEIAEVYSHIQVLKTKGTEQTELETKGTEQTKLKQPELGFDDISAAEKYCLRFCMTGHVLQLNENKLTLHLLGQIMNMAVEYEILQEEDFMTLSEKQIIKKLEVKLSENQNPETKKLNRLYRTFRTMTKIEHTQEGMSPDKYFCVNLKVKQRYINPLVKTEKGIFRLSEVSPFAKKIIEDFLSYSDTPFGCVELK